MESYDNYTEYQIVLNMVLEAASSWKNRLCGLMVC
jgi:hypothetical protein